MKYCPHCGGFDKKKKSQGKSWNLGFGPDGFARDM